MDTTSLVSVIILAYNVEQYIEECIVSIQKQTYRNLEIIIVINGKSKDNTEKLVLKIASTDDRIKLIYNRENSVIGDGRLLGMKAITGRYFTFVDGDDCLPENSIDYLVNLIEVEEADVVIGESIRVRDRDFPILSSPHTKKDIKIRNYSSPESYLPGCFVYMDYLLHGKLYKTSLYEISNIFLYPNSSLGEDVMIHVQLISFSQKIISSNVIVYYYRYNPHSISNNVNYELFRHVFQDMIWLEKYFDEKLFFSYPKFEMVFRTEQYVRLYYILSSRGLKAYKDFPDEVPSLLSSFWLDNKEIVKYLKQWKLFYLTLVAFRFNKYFAHLFFCEGVNLIRYLLRKWRLFLRHLSNK
jgi:Glycosyltransferases involved in cell wall biogenesis